MEYVDVRGEPVPCLGMGTWLLEGDDCSAAVPAALEAGYRHIDTAQIYGNEAEIGAALAESSVSREELFLTTKIWNDQHAADRVVASTEDSLRRLRTDYVDLLLIHWPVELERLAETLDAMVGLQQRELVRHIGVSNFTQSQLARAVQAAPVACIQVEYHPFLDQRPLVAAAARAGVALTAYSPLARGKVLSDVTLQRIGEEHGKTAAQVALRWLLDQAGVMVVPKATSAEHLGANIDVFDFSLTEDQRAQIDSLARGERLISPGWAPNWEE
jgi:2,5-diketo-D-gluconate reductase B